MEEGWVYVWQVPVPLEPNDLVLIKVGKADSPKLLNRLYHERLGWSKLFAKDTGRTYRKCSVITLHGPDIPTSSAAEREQEEIEEVLEEKGKTCKDFIFATHRTASIEQLEQYGMMCMCCYSDSNMFSLVRSLFGLPCKRTILEDAISHFNKSRKYGTNAILF